jgi:hypothetical protein
MIRRIVSILATDPHDAAICAAAMLGIILFVCLI